jgi:hypothetical protein
VSSGVGPVKMSHDEYTAKITDSIMRDFEVQATGVSMPSFRVPWYDKEEMEKNKNNFGTELDKIYKTVTDIHSALKDKGNKTIPQAQLDMIRNDLKIMYNIPARLKALYDSK